MENITLKIQGMHCEACKTLIKMELEENSLIDCVKSIELAENDNDQGKLELQSVSEDKKQKIVNVINNMPQYEVVQG